MVFKVTIAIDGMVPAQPLGPMVFNGFHSVNHWWQCFSMVANQRCDGNNTSFRLSTRTVHMIQYCYTLLLLLPKFLYFFAFLTLFTFSFSTVLVQSTTNIKCLALLSLFYIFFIKFYSSIEIDCCIFFLSEILVKNVLRSFLWIQDFIILGTQDPGILRSWKPRILGSWDFRILIS